MLQIDELVLRVPGLSEEEGRGLGEEVVRRVVDGLPAQQRDRRLGALDLSVSVPVGTSRSRMATLIAEAIVKGLV
jgi:hypothetical protein